MVDGYGRWYEEADYATYPKEEWCFYDHIAAWIRGEGYEIQTNMENLIDMILLHYEGDCEEQDKEPATDDCIEFVENSGGLCEFDYYA